MIWSRWKPLHSGIPPGQTEKKGLIEESLLPASAFRLSYYIFQQTEPDNLGIGTKFLNLNWRWQIHDSTDQVLFDQIIRGRINVTTLSFAGVGGGLTLFTWYWQDASWYIETSVPQPVYLTTGFQGGAPPPNMGTVSYSGPGSANFVATEVSPTDVPVQAVVSHQGSSTAKFDLTLRTQRGERDVVTVTIPGNTSAPVTVGTRNYVACEGISNVSGGSANDLFVIQASRWAYADVEKQTSPDPAGNPPGYSTNPDTPAIVSGGGMTDNEIWIDFEYYTAGYQVQIPTGSYVHMVYHYLPWSPWQTAQYTNIRIQTALAGGGDTTVDRPGIHRVAVSNSKGKMLYTLDEGRTYIARKIAGAVNEPCIMETPEHHLLVAAWVTQAYRILISKDNGRRWRQLTDWRGIPMPDSMWDPHDYASPTTCITKSGAIVTVARKGTLLYCKTSADGFNNATLVGTVQPNPFRLSCDPNTDMLYLADGLTKTFRSKTHGLNWEEVPLTEVL